VTFSETGLLTGTNWSVTVSSIWGGWGWHHVEKNASTGASLTFSLPNGTYHYRAKTPLGFTTTDGRGFFNVTGGSPPAIVIAYTPLVTYSVTFHEAGLASGTNWTVSLFQRWHHPHESATSDTSNVAFLLTNGSYYYHVAQVPGYVANMSFGSFAVNGTAVPTIDVTFTALVNYAVSFNESGLPTGTNWTVRIVGFEAGGGFVHQELTANVSTITFNLPNGTYFYHIEHVSGWYVSSGERRGAISVTGAAPPETSVVFSQGHSWP